MKIVRIVVSGTPIAKPRPKAWYNKKTGRMHHYYKNEKQIKGFENYLREKAEMAFSQPLTGPVGLTINFFLPRPKRLIWKSKPMPSCYCDKRPDWDNLAKAVCDGLNGVAWLDDGQVSLISIGKFYHAGDEGPRTEIEIKDLSQI